MSGSEVSSAGKLGIFSEKKPFTYPSYDLKSKLLIVKPISGVYK